MACGRTAIEAGRNSKSPRDLYRRRKRRRREKRKRFPFPPIPRREGKGRWGGDTEQGSRWGTKPKPTRPRGARAAMWTPCADAAWTP